jgi:hypothetical protein
VAFHFTPLIDVFMLLRSFHARRPVHLGGAVGDDAARSPDSLARIANARAVVINCRANESRGGPDAVVAVLGLTPESLGESRSLGGTQQQSPNIKVVILRTVVCGSSMYARDASRRPNKIEVLHVAAIAEERD